MADVKNEPQISTVEDVNSQELKNVWTVGRKFLISISVSIILLSVAAVVSVYYYNSIVGISNHSTGHTFVMRELGMKLHTNIKDYEFSVKEYVRTKDDMESLKVTETKLKIKEIQNLLEGESESKDERDRLDSIFETWDEALQFGTGYVRNAAKSNGNVINASSLTGGQDALGGSDDPLADLGDDPLADLGSDPLAGLGDDPLADLGSDPLADLGDDPLADLGSDPLADLGDDPLADLGSDPLADIGDDPLAGIGDDPLADLNDLSESIDDGISDDDSFDDFIIGEALGPGSGNGGMTEFSGNTLEMDLVLGDVYGLIEDYLINANVQQIKEEKKLIEANHFWAKTILLTIFIVLILFNLGQYLYFNRSVTRPIKSLRRYLLSMGKGELPDFKMKVWKDDIGEMVRALRGLLIGLKETALFAKELGEGNLDAEYSMLSNNDILGNSLMGMRDNLRKLADDDEKRNWVNQGVASFAEILRTNNDNLEVLSDQIVLYLVNYLKVNQGGLFLINEIDRKDIHLELAAVYAWDRRKFVDRKIEKGQGLVGQCWYEQKTIFMTDVPQNFVQITSGLGEATPRCILIVPLISNEEIYGVMEFASFTVMEDFEIDFVEKVAESIAAAIGNVRITERTKNLLEEAQQQGEELRANEEEMRQNMEEMNATQEEMDRIIQEKDVQIEKLLADIEDYKKAK